MVEEWNYQVKGFIGLLKIDFWACYTLLSKTTDSFDCSDDLQRTRIHRINTKYPSFRVGESHSREGAIRLQTGVVTPGNNETRNNSPEGPKGPKEQNSNQFNQQNP